MMMLLVAFVRPPASIVRSAAPGLPSPGTNTHPRPPCGACFADQVAPRIVADPSFHVRSSPFTWSTCPGARPLGPARSRACCCSQARRRSCCCTQVCCALGRSAPAARRLLGCMHKASPHASCAFRRRIRPNASHPIIAFTYCCMPFAAPPPRIRQGCRQGYHRAAQCRERGSCGVRFLVSCEAHMVHTAVMRASQHMHSWRGKQSMHALSCYVGCAGVQLGPCACCAPRPLAMPFFVCLL